MEKHERELENSNTDLDTFCRDWLEKAGADAPEVLYVNGDNNLENLRKPDEHWEVRLIEEEFQTRMFDTRDV